MKKCIVFDVDRTIVDSYMPELLSLQEAVENVTKKKISEDDINKLTSLPTVEFFKFLQLSEKEIVLINKEWEVTFSKYKTKCFPGIKEIIKDLYNNGFIISIITSRTTEEFHELDEELNDIMNCFNGIVTSDIIKNPKPNKESIEYLCNKLGLIPEEIIYVGDSEIDKIFSSNCNLDFIPACWENKELEKEERACFSIDNLKSMINYYNGIENDTFPIHKQG